jgi:dihydrofolate synthase / folylpolyglutamate synthase
MTLKEKISWIESRPRFKPKVDLEALKNVYEEKNLAFACKKIHIVGTNGKGSTAKMLTDMLSSDYQVGTFMSPYVYTFNERVLLNGVPIDDLSLNEQLDVAITLSLEYPELTFFELLILSTLFMFKKLKVDIMVMEAGIGGRLDSTNILTYDVSILTSIGHDHLNVLGPTLFDVLREKIAVVKQKGILISGADDVYLENIQAHCQLHQATLYAFRQEDINIINDKPLTFVHDNKEVSLRFLGRHYALNATLALKAIDVLGLQVKKRYEHLSKSSLLGRFEHIINQVFVDAAHNEESIKALKDMIDVNYPFKRVYIILSALGDKDVHKMIDILIDSAHIVLTSFEDLRYLDMSRFKREDVPFIDGYMNAYAYVVSKKKAEDIIIFTGSIHFISNIKSKLTHTS